MAQLYAAAATGSAKASRPRVAGRPPTGTMFVWAPIPVVPIARRRGSLAFAKHLIEPAGVAVSPGIGFGPAGEGFVRFALVRDVKGIDAAVAAIERALNVAPAR